MSLYDEALKHLHLTVELSADHKWDLQKITTILTTIQKTTATNIQVVGTNGKGTTAFLLTQILRGHNYNVGLFTSPHLISVNERICYNGNAISHEDFGEIYMALSSTFDEMQLSYFEKLVVVAAQFFSQTKPDFIVWEAGLGGRLDATTATKCDTVIFTPIAKDHTEYLGETIAEITYEKVFVSQFASAIFSSPQHSDVETKMREMLQKYQKKIQFAPQITNVEVSLEGTKFLLEGNHVSIGMLGEHYAQNTCLAWDVAKYLLKQNFCADIAVDALKGKSWPGRLQIISTTKIKYILSCAHNMHSLSSDLQTISQIISPSDTYVIFAVTRSRPAQKHLAKITEKFDNIIVTQANNEHPIPQELCDNWKCIKELEDAKSYIEKQNAKYCVVIGSIYLAGEFLKVLKNSEKL